MCVWLYIILILKRFKLQNQSILEYTDNYKQQLTRFVKFRFLIYVPYLFKTPLSSEAAVHNLALYKSLLQYSDIDSEISMAVLKVQSRHLWFLSPESIILWSMFRSVLADDENNRLACVLLSSHAQRVSSPRKSIFSC